MKKLNNVSAVVLINEKKELLLYLRDDKPTIVYPNMWALLGGHAEKNETPIETLKREIKEEIDFDIKETEFLGAVDDKVGNLVHIFLTRFDKRKEDIILLEGQKIDFFNYNESIKLNIPKPIKDFMIKNKEKILDYNPKSFNTP
jgi:8-oxo-dGTP diphosphatase